MCLPCGSPSNTGGWVVKSMTGPSSQLEGPKSFWDAVNRTPFVEGHPTNGQGRSDSIVETPVTGAQWKAKEGHSCCLPKATINPKFFIPNKRLEKASKIYERTCHDLQIFMDLDQRARCIDLDPTQMGSTREIWTLNPSQGFFHFHIWRDYGRLEENIWEQALLHG